MTDKKEYRIRVDGVLVEVTQEVYQSYYRMRRREAFLIEKDIDHGVELYSNLDTDETLGEEMLPDLYSPGVEERAITNVLSEMIFAAYLSGQNMKEIADHLNHLSTQTPEIGIRKWSYRTVSRILTNEKYMGDSLWQKTYRTDTFPSQERPNRREREQYYVAGTHPAIIEKGDFIRANELLAQRNEKKKQAMRPNTNPLPCPVICSLCGTRLRRKTIRHTVYRCCPKHDADGNTCSLHQIPEIEIEKAFLRLWYKLKHHPEPLLQMEDNLQAIRNRRMLWSLDIVALNKRIADLSSQDQMLAQLKQQGLVDPDIFISQQSRLAEQIRAAKQEKARFLDTEEDTTLRHTQNLLDTLDAGPDFLETFDGDLFGELVERVIVETNNKVRFRLKNGLELEETIERAVR